MKQFIFKVTTTDIFTKEITIEGKNKKEALEKLQKDLEANPIEFHSNVFESSDTKIKEIK